jgi:hypothetical protein
MATLNTLPQQNFPVDPGNEGERLDIIFRALVVRSIFITINSLVKGEFNWRHLTDLQIEGITSKIIATNLVEYKKEGYHYSILVKPHSKVTLQKFGNSYLQYLESLNQKSERLQEKENLEMQKLRAEVEKLVNDLGDYPTTKKRARISYGISILSILLAATALLLPWLCKKSG